MACLCSIGLLSALNTSVSRAASFPTGGQAVMAGHGATVAGTSRAPGDVPAGWRVYRGTRAPFVIAYPPRWSVDETNSPIGEVSFLRVTRAGSVSATIATRGSVARKLPVLVLRAQFVSFATRTCEQGRKLDRTGSVAASTAQFATAIFECKSGEAEAGHSHRVAVFYLGVALQHGVQWTFLFQSSKKLFQKNLREYFTPMLKTLRP